MFEHITASEVAGYGVGVLLLSATVSATKLDSFIASSQRSSIGMCKRCGDLRLIPCSTCRGSGSIGDLSLQSSLRVKSTKPLVLKSCSKCESRGHFCCPSCSKAPLARGN